MRTHSCGCITTVDPWAGAVKAVSKCANHTAMQRETSALGREYYEHIGAIVDGIPQSRHYARELLECVDVPKAKDKESGALEIGCGCSMYVPLLLARGYDYVGLEPSRWAAEWVKNTHDVFTINSTLEDAALTSGHYQLVMLAHSLEHMVDARFTLETAARLMTKDGALIIIVPNDDDLLNPDHLWFFSEKALRAALNKCGLVVDTLVTKQRIERERFMYVRASKQP